MNQETKMNTNVDEVPVVSVKEKIKAAKAIDKALKQLSFTIDPLIRDISFSISSEAGETSTSLPFVSYACSKRIF